MSSTLPSTSSVYTTHKRPRSASPSTTPSLSPPPSASRSPSPTLTPTPKATRLSLSHSYSSSHSGPESPRNQLICMLPPTCHRHPITIADTRSLEAHYATHHAHVCEQRGCGCVFPDGRLLELHQTECHDPLAALRKERGEKIFACHLPTCPRHFRTPKSRRLHLIEAHGYPKQYFFAVTNKGVGGLLRKWGEGVSLVRGEWKARNNANRGGGASGSNSDDSDSSDDGEEDEEDGEQMEVIQEDQDELELPQSSAALQNTKRNVRTSKPQAPLSQTGRLPDPDPNPDSDRYHKPNNNRPFAQSTRAMSASASTSNPATTSDTLVKTDADADTLASDMATLALVPRAVRFGRGGLSGGLGDGHGRGVRGGGGSRGGGGGGGAGRGGDGSVDRGRAGGRGRARARGRVTGQGRGRL